MLGDRQKTNEYSDAAVKLVGSCQRATAARLTAHSTIAHAIIELALLMCSRILETAGISLKSCAPLIALMF